MKPHSAVAAISLLILAVALATVACQNPNRPGSPGTIQSVRIVVPAQVAPGQTAALKVLGTYASGAQVDLTSKTQWSTSSIDTGTIQVSADGQVTGGTAG